MEWGIRMWFSATGMFPDSVVHVAPLLDAGSFPDSSPHWFPLDFAGQQCVTPRCPEAGPAGNPWPDVRCSWCWRHCGCRLSCAGRAEGIGSCHGAAEIDARGGAGRVNPELAWSEMKRIKTFLMENFHFRPFENLDGCFFLCVFFLFPCQVTVMIFLYVPFLFQIEMFMSMEHPWSHPFWAPRNTCCRCPVETKRCIWTHLWWNLAPWPFYMGWRQGSLKFDGFSTSSSSI